MDYIIFGIGSSATLVLVGWALRDWGPRLRDRKPPGDGILSASDLVTRMAWTRFCAACGMAILLCGALVMLVTLGAAYFAPSDRAAAIAVVSAFGLGLLLMLVWTNLYLRQFGALGVLRPRPKRESPKPLATPAPAAMAAANPVISAADATEQPGPSFAETTASRGGLGRFAAFFRKDTAGETAPVANPRMLAPAPDAVPKNDTPAADDDSGGAEITPTEAVIAELSGEADDSEAKKLAPDDPLVTSVRMAAPVTSIEDEVVTDMLGPDREQRSSDTDEAAPGDATLEPAGDAAGTKPDSQEVALSQLRRRRLSRLSKPGEPE